MYSVYSALCRSFHVSAKHISPKSFLLSQIRAASSTPVQIAAEAKRAKPPDGGEDCLSALHDNRLLRILVLLDTTEAARTSVLACRWKRLWRILPMVHFNPAPDGNRIRDVLTPLTMPRSSVASPSPPKKPPLIPWRPGFPPPRAAWSVTFSTATCFRRAPPTTRRRRWRRRPGREASLSYPTSRKPPRFSSSYGMKALPSLPRASLTSSPTSP